MQIKSLMGLKDRMSKILKINISGSIDLANHPIDTNNTEELISLADKQMYVKKEGI